MHQQDIRICFVGDSYVNGTGDPEYLGWTGRICAHAHKKGYAITHYNLGVRRETSEDIKKRWLREVSCRLPKQCNCKVVFSFGTNDTTIENGKTRVDLTASIENTRSILTEAKQLYSILMISPAPGADREQNQRTADLSKQFALVCNQLNVPYLDVFSMLEKSKIWIDEAKSNDDFHPGAAGYTELAEIIQTGNVWLNWLDII
ncbi:MAG: GDSL-type esterase/lipase family protein [Scytonema sp. PMC 1069.18]|nr:GDSL-type esterase/lipase family protein [Scytonema sp. PMC 1069.18]MEC4887750.1 GDSL-type esterase/lipase family protein [Scytonema sp. PMC 1070.18]